MNRNYKKPNSEIESASDNMKVWNYGNSSMGCGRGIDRGGCNVIVNCGPTGPTGAFILGKQTAF